MTGRGQKRDYRKELAGLEQALLETLIVIDPEVALTRFSDRIHKIS